jgi:hypothetical protein
MTEARAAVVAGNSAIAAFPIAILLIALMAATVRAERATGLGAGVFDLAGAMFPVALTDF